MCVCVCVCVLRTAPLDRSVWRQCCSNAISAFEERRTAAVVAKRKARKDRVAARGTMMWTCDVCGRQQHSVTEVSLSRGLVSGIAFQDTYATRILPTAASGVNSRPIGFLATGAQCDILLNCAL